MRNPIVSRKLRLLLTPPVLLLALVLAAVACGGSEDGSGETADGGPLTTFDITLGDEPGEAGAISSFFTPNEFTVTAGQEVTFNLSNDGTAVHNLRIAGPDGEYNTDDDILVGPEILNPGDTAVAKWTAPSEPRAIIFRCDFHPIDMIGAITIE